MRARPGSSYRPRQRQALLAALLTATAATIAAAPALATPAASLAKGKFLVATRQLEDPHFAETVVLLLEYGPAGAIGLVINRPSEVKLQKALPDLDVLRRRSDPVHLGGPVSPQHILLLVRADKAPPQSQLVFGSVYLTGSLDTLKSLVAQKTPSERMRAYAGYAGWAPHQLEYEVERGDWNVVAADAETIFVTPTKDVWPHLLERGSGQWAAAATWQPGCLDQHISESIVDSSQSIAVAKQLSTTDYRLTTIHCEARCAARGHRRARADRARLDCSC